MAYPTLSILSHDDVVYFLSKNTHTGSMEALIDVDARPKVMQGVGVLLHWEMFYAPLGSQWGFKIPQDGNRYLSISTAQLSL
jgi:hypothetical protein